MCVRAHVCVFVKGAEVRRRGYAVMQGLFSSIRWAQLGPFALAFKQLCGIEVKYSLLSASPFFFSGSGCSGAPQVDKRMTFFQVLYSG